MKKAVLIRLNENKKQTLGRLFLFNGLDCVFECCTLELPNFDNAKNISCIPTGQYNVKPRKSKKYGEHFLVENVNFRSYILIHEANYHTELKGCIAVGDNYYDINNDHILDITNSKKTKKRLLALAPDGFDLTILEKI